MFQRRRRSLEFSEKAKTFLIKKKKWKYSGVLRVYIFEKLKFDVKNAFFVVRFTVEFAVRKQFFFFRAPKLYAIVYTLLFVDRARGSVPQIKKKKKNCSRTANSTRRGEPSHQTTACTE